MSSHDEDQDRSTEKSSKRRRIGRACDMCRLKKSDGERAPGQRCSNCAAYDEECTFVRAAPKRQSRPRGYVRRLEARIAAMESLLSSLCPAADLSHEIDTALERSRHIDNFEYEESDFSDGDEQDWFMRPGEKGKARAGNREQGDHFAYALPPAFSPTVSTQHQRTISPLASIMSSPTVESAAAPFMPVSGDKESQREVRQHVTDLESSDDELAARQALGRLSLDPQNVNVRRYFGKSSSIAILNRALELKVAYESSPGIAWQNGSRDETSLSPEERALRQKVRVFDAKLRATPGGPGLGFDPYRQRMRPLPCMCPASCIVHPWACPTLRLGPSPPLVFPVPDLMHALIDLYFSAYNIYTPVVHQPLFLTAIADGVHLRDADFGSIVLLVCALGARFSDDLRVLLDEDGKGAHHGRERDGYEGSSSEEEDRKGRRIGRKEDEWHSAGWKWFSQVRLGRTALAAPVSLYDIQICCLASLYLRGSSAPESSRIVAGMGLRIAQDFGAHRRKVYGAVPSEEGELLKRTFWVLVWLDWTISSTLGRPCAIQYEDFDLDFPIECDDEYWVTPDPAFAFRQPEGKPSLIAYFNSQLRLNQINAFTLRTIYSTNKSKALLGFVGPEWEQRIVAELDSALNAWLDSIPKHLRWDPNNPDLVFLNQSASLYTTYYSLQIMIHRPFIPSPRRLSRTSFPSLAICTNAARSCVHVLDTVYRRSGTTESLHINLFPLFTSGIVLMLNMWGSDSHSSSTIKEMEDVHKAMRMLKVIESRWHSAGRLWDLLYELAVVGDLLPPRDDSPQSYPLYKEPDIRSTTNFNSHTLTTHKTSASHRFTQPLRRGSISRMPIPNQANSTPSHVEQGRLPLRTDELGRLPLHSVSDTNPSATWHEYDLSPSVFNPPTTATTPPKEMEQVDPALDSVFTAPRQRRERRADSLHQILAPQPVFPGTASFPSTLLASTTTESPIPYSSPPAQIPSLAGPSAQSASADNETLAMWLNAPQSFEFSDWGTYISSVANANATAEGTSSSTSFGHLVSVSTGSFNLGDSVYAYYDQPV